MLSLNNDSDDQLTAGRRKRRVSPLESRRFWLWFSIVLACALARDAGLIAPLAAQVDPSAAEAELESATSTDEPEASRSSESGQAKKAAEEGSQSESEHAAGGAGEAGEESMVDESAEEHSAGGHADPVAPVLLGIMVILLVAKLGGDFFERLSMPAVLGELTVGVLLGNFTLMTGEEWFNFLLPESSTGAMLDILARIGVVLLLFEVGLESRVSEMLSVGVSSLLVAILGVVAPMALGWGVSAMLIPDHGWQVHAFIGATLCATSVGITARVLKDLGRSQQTESRIILGAAVIDDVLGLVVLAIVSGAIMQGEVSASGLVQVVGLAFGFLVVALLLGAFNLPRFLFKSANFLRGHGLLVATALVICFGFAYLANVMGLATIIGAFAAGLILEGAHYRELGQRENRSLESALAPLTALLVPIFFVEMGIQVKLSSFTDSSVWGLAVAITLMAILGKQICSLGVREKGLNKIAVGLGMIPRGEVGLIFASEGRRLVAPAAPGEPMEPVITTGTYSAVVVMVMITTMVTPPLLKWSLQRSDPDPGENTEDEPAHAAADS